MCVYDNPIRVSSTQPEYYLYSITKFVRNTLCRKVRLHSTILVGPKWFEIGKVNNTLTLMFVLYNLLTRSEIKTETMNPLIRSKTVVTNPTTSDINLVSRSVTPVYSLTDTSRPSSL